MLMLNPSAPSPARRDMNVRRSIRPWAYSSYQSNASCGIGRETSVVVACWIFMVILCFLFYYGGIFSLTGLSKTYRRHSMPMAGRFRTRSRPTMPAKVAGSTAVSC